MSVLPSLAKASVAPSAASTWRTRTRSARTRPSRTPTRTGCPSTSSRCCSIPRSLASSRSIGSTLPTPVRSSRDARACTWSARPPAPDRATTRHPPGESTGTKNRGCPALGSIHQEVVPVLARAAGIRRTVERVLGAGPEERRGIPPALRTTPGRGDLPVHAVTSPSPRPNGRPTTDRSGRPARVGGASRPRSRAASGRRAPCAARPCTSPGPRRGTRAGLPS